MLQETTDVYDYDNEYKSQDGSFSNLEELLLFNKEMEEKKRNYITKNYVLYKLVSLLIIYIIYLPFAIADIYYALNDRHCIDQNIKNIPINLFDCLMSSGTYTIVMILIITIMLCVIDFDTIQYDKKTNNIIHIYIVINKLFIISIHLVSAILFWLTTDTKLCNNEVFIYLYISLIIKVICNTIICVDNSMLCMEIITTKST